MMMMMNLSNAESSALYTSFTVVSLFIIMKGNQQKEAADNAHRWNIVQRMYRGYKRKQDLNAVESRKVRTEIELESIDGAWQCDCTEEQSHHHYVRKRCCHVHHLLTHTHTHTHTHTRFSCLASIAVRFCR